MRVLIIVPAHNEEQNIEDVVHTIQRAGYDYLVIDDGSSDSTAQICRDAGFNFVSLSQNLGIGGAVQTGHLYAFQNGYDVDVQFDGDGQHDINYVPVLLEGIQAGSDLVIGSRFLAQTEGFKSSKLRRVGINWLRFWIRLFTGQTITDATSGFRACDRKVIALFANSYPIDYPEPESIVTVHHCGLAVSEVPVVMHERQGGRSSIGGFKSAYYMIKVSLAIAVAGLSKRR